MGILNLTPDSFSDGGEVGSLGMALDRAEAMIDEGADIIDAGGESTRPGAPGISEAEERARVLPFIAEAARRFPAPISVDTRKAVIAGEALEAGATIVNDVSGLRGDDAMAGVVADAGAGVVLMHMRGTPSTMAGRTDYRDLMAEVGSELEESVERASEAGISPDRIVLDPGIGFSKTGPQSRRLLRELDRLAALGFPLMVGPSRKSFLGEILGTPPGDRLEGTLAACVVAYVMGARIFRVHDVRAVVRALSVARCLRPDAGE